MLYHPVEPIERDKAEEIFDLGNEAAIVEALLSLAYYEPNGRWVQEKCLAFAQRGQGDVRRIAIVCLGHLARVHRKLDLDRVAKVFNELRDDTSVLGEIENAVGDIRVFVDHQFDTKIASSQKKRRVN